MMDLLSKAQKLFKAYGVFSDERGMMAGVIESLRVRVLALEKENEELKAKFQRFAEANQWDALKIVEGFEEEQRLESKNQRLREALEEIAKPTIGWDGSSNEMRQIARQALKDARAALAQAAKKEA